MLPIYSEVLVARVWEFMTLPVIEAEILIRRQQYEVDHRESSAITERWSFKTQKLFLD
jgi:hypothetical protein